MATVDELINKLKEIKSNHGGDLEVFFQDHEDFNLWDLNYLHTITVKKGEARFFKQKIGTKMVVINDIEEK